MTPNPLNGNLCVAVAGGAEHVLNVREPKAICGQKITQRHTVKDFPISPDKACLPCILGLMTHAIGTAQPTPEGPTGG